MQHVFITVYDDSKRTGAEGYCRRVSFTDATHAERTQFLRDQLATKQALEREILVATLFMLDPAQGA